MRARLIRCRTNPGVVGGVYGGGVRASVLVGVFLVFVVNRGLLWGDALKEWEWVSPWPQGQALENVEAQNGVIRIVNSTGRLWASEDLENWTLTPTPVNTALTDLAFGNGVYVAVGPGGVLVSSNALEWELVETELGSRFRRVVFGNDVFVASGRNTLGTSNDGRTWGEQSRVSPVSGDMESLAFAADRFVVSDSAFGFLTSEDGTNWTRHGDSSFEGGIARGGERLLVAGWYFETVGNGSILTGGLWTWSEGGGWEFESLGTGVRPRDLVYGNGRFVMLVYPDTVWVSTDGSSWTVGSIGSDALERVGRLCFADGQFVGVGLGGNIVSSLDGLDWTRHREVRVPAKLGDVVETRHGFVAGGDALQSSSDGLHWTVRDTNRVSWVVPWDEGILAIGSGKLFLSTNAVEWEAHPLPDELAGASRYAYGNGVFVALGGAATAWSVDGLHWERHERGGFPAALAFCLDRLFVQVGGMLGFTLIGTSTNGLDWSYPLSGTTNQLGGVASHVVSGNGRIVVTGQTLDSFGREVGVVWVSLDGQEWVRQETARYYRGLTFAGGLFLIHDGTVLLSSVDGFRWFSRELGDELPDQLIFADGRFVALRGSAVLKSADTRRVLSGSGLGEDGVFRMSLDGLLGCSYDVEWSRGVDSKGEWWPLTTVEVLSGPASVEDPGASEDGERYYRAVRLEE